MADIKYGQARTKEYLTMSKENTKTMCFAFIRMIDKCLAQCSDCTAEEFVNCLKDKLGQFEQKMIKRNATMYPMSSTTDDDKFDNDYAMDKDVVEESRRYDDEYSYDCDKYTDDDIEDLARLCDYNRKSSYDYSDNEKFMRGFRKNNGAYNEYMSEENEW